MGGGRGRHSPSPELDVAAPEAGPPSRTKPIRSSAVPLFLATTPLSTLTCEVCALGVHVLLCVVLDAFVLMPIPARDGLLDGVACCAEDEAEDEEEEGAAVDVAD